MKKSCPLSNSLKERLRVIKYFLNVLKFILIILFTISCFRYTDKVAPSLSIAIYIYVMNRGENRNIFKAQKSEKTCPYYMRLLY